MKKLKELREEKGLSQTELGTKIGLTQITVSRYERGETEPDIATIKKLCELFEVSADFLLDIRDY